MKTNDLDLKCFKCIDEMQQTTQTGPASILRMKMQQNIAGQDLDDIYVCDKHK